MPQLDKATADKVAQAEATGGVMDEGTYEMVLVSVTDTDKNGKALSGPKGPYWKWELQIPETAERFRNWRQWRNVSLSEEAAPIMQSMFNAFGATPETNTDELIGKTCRVKIGKRTVQDGPNTGDVTNFIKAVEPLDGTTVA